MPAYLSANHPDQISVDFCYFCNNSLGHPISPDHIIPDALFEFDSIYRPQLPVHTSCNNRKSKDDEWFLRRIQLLSSSHPDAGSAISYLLDKANKEKANAYLIGKSKEELRNYKLAHTLFGNIKPILEVSGAGENLVLLQSDQANMERQSHYLRRMARGLFIRNTGTDPWLTTSLYSIDYAHWALKKGNNPVHELLLKLAQMSRSSMFHQQWSDRVGYCGAQAGDDPRAGFLYIEFYRKIGFLSAYWPEPMSRMVNAESKPHG